MNNYYIPTAPKDLDEDGLPSTEGHDCLDFLKFRAGTETREEGAYEADEYQCTVCHEKYSTEDVDRMYNPDPIQVKLPAGIVPDLAAYTGAECVACGSERKSVVTERILAHTPETVCCGEVA